MKVIISWNYIKLNDKGIVMNAIHNDMMQSEWIDHAFLTHQANVYHATTASGESRAIKIYKTSILLFKDRDKYVSGEFRSGTFSLSPP